MNFQLFDAYTNFIALDNIDKVVYLNDSQRSDFASLLDMAHYRDDIKIVSHVKAGKRLVIVTPSRPQFDARVKRLHGYIDKNMLTFTSIWIGSNAFDRYKISGLLPENLVMVILRPALKDDKMKDTINYLKNKAETVIYDIPM